MEMFVEATMTEISCAHICPEFRSEQRVTKRRRSDSFHRSAEDTGKRRRLDTRRSSFSVRKPLRSYTRRRQSVQACLPKEHAVAPVESPPGEKRKSSLLDKIKRFCRRNSSRGSSRHDSAMNHWNSSTAHLLSSPSATPRSSYDDGDIQSSPEAWLDQTPDGRTGEFNWFASVEAVPRHLLDSRPPSPTEGTSRALPYTNLPVPSCDSFSPQLPTQPIQIPARPASHNPSSIIPQTARPAKHSSSPPLFNLHSFNISSPPLPTSRPSPATHTGLYSHPAAYSPPLSPLSNTMMFPLSPDTSTQDLSAAPPSTPTTSDSDSSYLELSPQLHTPAIDALTRSFRHTSLASIPESGAPRSRGSDERCLQQLDGTALLRNRLLAPLDWADSELVFNYWRDEADCLAGSGSGE
ncbi:hypothetical protein P153DRAFT_393735 [Dothidotthia symphoricarpi CBS 119687]|uniref:Uncharacterized protein n=1 Tax=Dothidotthia symphoricarpi CBS 119687 TaxID=1392245 RepID=A0A6A6ALU7_9PLEO|nr:uncharacterized protein P153DRAFT_393735 [Dothidotthia symphoricarpi CBS 119687]KAF2132780.1 hypothetical protein P153DRAFT_393735 [Dothidotthia symphoricarpi CBS 119687]